MDEFDYDVCLSFAGEQRDYVRELADELNKHNIRVFFDEFEEAELWGKDLYEHLANIYGQRAKYCIIFASENYADKAWTSHERRAAQERALKEKGEYILPARFDQTAIPGLNSNVNYIDLSKKSPSQVAELFLKKVGFEATATNTADLLAERFGAEWAKDIELFTDFGSRPSFQCTSTALRRAAELGIISKHGIRTRLLESFVYLRIPHPDQWLEETSIPLHLEKRFHNTLFVHEWSPSDSFVDVAHIIATRLRATEYWEGESNYYPDVTFSQLSSVLLYGIQTIRNGLFGVINRVFQIVEDDWIITEWEIIDKENHYQILFERFDEDDWISHVTDKIWVNKGAFREAFDTARMLIYRQIFPGNLPEGWSPPKPSVFDLPW